MWSQIRIQARPKVDVFLRRLAGCGPFAEKYPCDRSDSGLGTFYARGIYGLDLVNSKL